MHTPGYYQTNYRALRFRELRRMHGLGRACLSYWQTRFMRPAGGAWMPSLWADVECQREDLSPDFWQATKPHRQDFERLGFTECGLQKATRLLNPMVREAGGINYLDPSGRYFGQLHYHRLQLPSRGANINQIIIAFTAAYVQGSLSCTNNHKSFDPPDQNEVIRVDSYDVPVIYQRFLEAVQQQKEAPRQFGSVEALRRWFDERQVKAFEERASRRLFVPMTDQQVTNARIGLRNTPADVLGPVRLSFRQWGWVALIALIVLLQALRSAHQARTGRSGYGGSGSSDRMEYRGQHFKMRKAYATWEDYKDDPNNLDTNELERIEQAMVSAKIPTSFPSRKEWIKFASRLEFPGYGMAVQGVASDDGSKVEADSVEIPQRDKERWMVVREAGGGFNLVDDFIYATSSNQISQVKLEKGKLRYYDRAGRLLREKQP